MGDTPRPLSHCRVSSIHHLAHTKQGSLQLRSDQMRVLD
jgi:hypothetical protein